MPLIRTLHFADVHLESDAVKTEDTLKGFWHIVLSVDPSTLDAISISGDTFDKAMIVPASKLPVILVFGKKLLEYCDLHNIVLRLLEGTPSHDRGQPQIFVTIAEMLGLQHCIEYYPELTLVKDSKTGLNVLYVPDEVNHDNAVTLTQAKALLKQNGLTKADMISMHGSFKYQIGMILSRPHHLEIPWMEICNYYIVCGHVHGHSTYGDTILVPSSTNRTAHNEEKAKGAILTTIDTDTGNKSWEFIENIYATVFVTLDVREKPLGEVHTLLKGLTYPKGSNVRLLVNKGSDVLRSFAALRSLYPDFKLKRKIADDKVEEQPLTSIQVAAVQGVSITFGNLSRLLTKHLEPTTGISPDCIALLDKHVAKCQEGKR